ncbi:hypothetical protein [Bosea rubneri]|uniref:Uncharacterized protein n=1 Tax=Bosea rubneri TaxID=3075434 RepID=A0ABU3SE38_9HYPH|nr:hypothetical protein [Bosea sp. ZW T0_25]MDU0343034.1 hypothetical protein [Bosea sp. ZW T0_25]
MPSHLTRRQLYDMIWSHEMTQVVAHLGISEWQIRQICESHRVPLPTAAFWRDRAAGRRAKQAIFTSTMNAALELITYNPTSPSEPLAAIEAPPAAVAKPATPKRAPTARSPVIPVEWCEVERPHQLLAATAKALRSAKPDQHGIVVVGAEQIPAMSLAQASVERAVFILDGLFQRLIAQDITGTLSRQHFQISRGEDHVEFKFSEKIAQREHEPTLSELQAEARRIRNGGSNSDWYWSKAYPQFDLVPTGILRLSIISYGGMGRRKNWQDGKRNSLETQVAGIAEVIADWLEGERQSRLERERQSRLWRRADENRQLAAARKRREDERDALIVEIVQLQAKARDLSAWIDWAAPIDDPETKRMLEWARKRLASIERAVNPARFGDWIREKKLFPEVDPFAPLPSDPDLETGT